MKFVRPNGHNCGISSNVFDILTFGTGQLDGDGFWELGCYDCARAYEAQFPDDSPCWPHTDEQLKQMGFNNEND